MAFYYILALVWAAFLLSTGPLNAFLAKRGSTKQVPTKRESYSSAVRALVILGGITLAIDALDDMPGVITLLAWTPPPVLVVWTILTSSVCLGVSIGFLLLRKTLGRPLPLSIVRMLPVTRRDLRGWTGISLVAGVSEEYLFRGFCLVLLVHTLSSPPVAFLLVTLAFGIGHGYQDLLGVVRSTLAGAVLAIPVLAIGALIPSIVAHVAIDVFAGLTGYSSLLKRWKIVPVLSN